MNDFDRAVTPHRLVLEDRHRLTLSGVEDVGRFDETEILMNTCAGTLLLRGEELHIEKLSLEGGEVHITGTILSLAYEEPRPTGGFFSRLLGT